MKASQTHGRICIYTLLIIHYMDVATTPVPQTQQKERKKAPGTPAGQATITASQMLWVVLVTHLCGCQCISMLAVITCCERAIWPSASQLGATVGQETDCLYCTTWTSQTRSATAPTILLIHILLCHSRTKWKNKLVQEKKNKKHCFVFVFFFFQRG